MKTEKKSASFVYPDGGNIIKNIIKNMPELLYKNEYDAFMESYKVGQVSGEQIGEMIARLAQYYGDINTSMASSSQKLNAKAAIIIQGEDESTGKSISAVKADVLLKDTDEFKEYNKVKTHLTNIEQYINALKYLQKGVLNEYAHVSGM